MEYYLSADASLFALAQNSAMLAALKDWPRKHAFGRRTIVSDICRKFPAVIGIVLVLGTTMVFAGNPNTGDRATLEAECSAGNALVDEEAYADAVPHFQKALDLAARLDGTRS